MTVKSSARQDIHNSDIPVLCRSCEARHRGICGAMTPEQLLKLSKHTRRTLKDTDANLIVAESKATQVSNILRGVVKLTKIMPDGRQQIVGLQFAPDFLGTPFGEYNNVDAEAANNVQLCSFPKAILEDMIHESPELEHKLHQQALKQLDEAREMMLTLGRKTAAEKIASFLYMLAIHLDPEIDHETEQVEFELPLKRADIADYLGLTIETVSRQITKLRKDGVVQIENNRLFKIPDIERLKARGES
ncbi:MAG: Crp/Fnr family transcriptional regulator [Rhizobiaceae bacterium]|nr:Crp/Fnr family transcriptional regulator [Rhizobiaceae bacterium]